MIPYKRVLGKRGDSYSVFLPKDIIDGLNLIHGDQMSIIVKEGKHGKYIAIWCEGKQHREENAHDEP